MKHTTSFAVTRVHLPRFLEIIERQFTNCGVKYAFSEDAEWTDAITSMVPTWVEGTIIKYVGRYRQYGAERDLIKIATYAFILAIKHGLVEDDPPPPIRGLYCTTVGEKARQWPQFRDMVARIHECLIENRRTYFIPDAMSGFDITRQFDDLSNLTQILIQIQQFEYQRAERKRWLMPIVAFLCFIQWVQDGHHLNAKHDEDDPAVTNGEKKDVEEV